MARQRVSLWIRIKTAEGKRPYCRPCNTPKNGWALVAGQPERHLEDGVYHIRYEVAGKRIWENVGKDYRFAEAKRKMREGELELNPGTVAPATPARLTLAEQKSR